jgi:hypothetical protein
LPRVFILLYLAWAVVVLVIVPIHIADANRSTAVQLESAWAALPQDYKTPDRSAVHEKTMMPIWEDTTLPGVYRQFSWYWILAAVVIPPVLLFTICWGFVALARWIAKGFSDPKSTTVSAAPFAAVLATIGVLVVILAVLLFQPHIGQATAFDLLKGTIGPVVGALIALGATYVGISRQLRHDALQKQEERRINLLRDVYLEALEAVWSEHQIATRLLLTTSDDPLPALKEIAEKVEQVKPYYPKILLCGSLETIKAFGQLQGISQTLAVLAAKGLVGGVVATAKHKSDEAEKQRLADELAKPGADREELERRLKGIEDRSLKYPFEKLAEIKARLEVRQVAVAKWEGCLAEAVRAARRDLAMKAEDEAEFYRVTKSRSEESAKELQPILDTLAAISAYADRLMKDEKKQPDTGDERQRPQG